MMKIIRQRDSMDCGICSLLSIISFYGGYVSLEQLRIDAGVSSEGTSALNLIMTAKKYGFDASGFKCQSLNELKTLPAIAHLNLSNGLTHYVVIYKILGDSVILMDPAKGKVKKDKDKFLEEWSGVVLIFYPREKITVLKSNNTIFSIVEGILKSSRKLVISIALTSFILTLFTIAGSYYFQVASSVINSNVGLNVLKFIVLLFFGFTIFKIGLSFIRGILVNHLSKNIDCFINADFIKHLYNIPLNILTSRSSGEIVTRVGELSHIKGLITDLLVTCSLDLVLVLITLPLLKNISSDLFLILILSLLLYLIEGLISSKIIYKKAYKTIEYEAEFNNNLLEDIKMINSIKNLSATNYRLDIIEKTLCKYLYDEFLLNEFLNKDKTFKIALKELCYFLINSWGFYLVFKRGITIYDLITFNMLLEFFFSPLKNIIDTLPKYNFLKATITKINEFWSVEEEVSGNIQDIRGFVIDVKNLSYSYNNYKVILDNINFLIEEGEFVLLDGASGSGKSTICSILDKYITDYKGEVLVGSVNIKDLSIATIRGMIQNVNQQENLLTGTIKENILLGRTCSIMEFERVCKICLVDCIASSKPLRYDTIINTQVSNMSGGEKQRIILARALLNDFKILILDEALSEVDKAMELKIIKNIRSEFSDKTIIYVTHKKSNLKFDKVIRMDKLNEVS